MEGGRTMSLEIQQIVLQDDFVADGYGDGRVRRRTAKRCAGCGALAWHLCDECGTALCSGCRRPVGERDLCPGHLKAA